jgi:hypothetical protein
MDDLAKLQLNIDSLREGNQIDWRRLGTEWMTAEERKSLRTAITIRNEELDILLKKKWALEAKARK